LAEKIVAPGLRAQLFFHQFCSNFNLLYMGNQKIISCTDAKKIELIEYLSKLGHQPQKIRNHDYWYLSPLREEKEPSFKVNKKMNVWYDHGIGEGGNIIDFGLLYYRCSISDF
jgi:hypothetical protein